MSRLKRRLEFNVRYLFGAPRWDTGVVPPEVTAYVGSHPPGRALDLGCGTGTNLLYLAQHDWQVTGVDFSRVAVNAARRRLKNAGVSGNVFVDDVAVLTTVQGSYNYILDIGCYHQLSAVDRKAYQSNLLRLLDPGGNWMLYGHCRSPQAESAPGLTESDITQLGGLFELQQRQNGRDGPDYTSVWLWFERKLE